MYKAVIGAGALLLATATVPASADRWYGNGYGYYSGGYGSGYGYNGSG